MNNKECTTMKFNIQAVKRENVKRERREKKKDIKADNKKRSRSVKKYHDNFDF
jgi:hypothetical protein